MNEPESTKMTNIVTVTGKGIKSIIAKASFFIGKSVDLIVEQSINNPKVYLGEKLTYTIVITNNSSYNANEIILTNIISQNADLVSVVSSQGNYYISKQRIIYKLDKLPSGSQSIIFVTILPKITGTIQNFVNVLAKEHDPNLYNNTSVENITIYPHRYRGVNVFSI